MFGLNPSDEADFVDWNLAYLGSKALLGGAKPIYIAIIWDIIG